MANVVYFNDGVKLPCCPTLLESLYLSASGTCAGDCNANYTGFVAGDLSYNIVYTLPTASGTSGQVLTTDGNNNLSWTTVSGGGGGTGYVPYVGAIQNVNLGSFSLASSGVTTPYLQISTAGSSTPMQEGMLRWNNTDRTYEFMMGGGNVLQQIGQELPVPVKNADNAGLQNGKVVYYVSSDGTNKLVRYAIASGESESAGVFGLMTEDATGGNKALCTTFGYVRDIDTSTLEEGKIVWLSDTELGGMTTTRPTQPSHGVQVGFCIRQHATEGAIFVSIQNGYELDELHNVLISSGITDQEMLFYNSALKVWENKTAAAANLVSGSGTATQVAFWRSGSTNELQGSSNLYWDNVNGRLGVGTNTPTRTLDVVGDLSVGTTHKWSFSSNIFSPPNSTNGFINVPSGRYLNITNSLINSGIMSFDNDNRSVFIGNRISSPITEARLVVAGSGITAAGWTAQFHNSGGTSNSLMIRDDGNVAIGNNSPNARLQVHGTDTSDTGWTAQFHNSLGNSNSLMIRNDGNVGIGTTGTTARLVVRGSGTTSAAAALLVQNSGGSQLLSVDNSGRLQFGSESVRLMPTGNGTSIGLTGRGLLLDSLIGSASNIGEFTIAGSISSSSGDSYTFRGRSTFIPTSGAATYSGLWVTTTINQTGGASGTTRGLFVDPVLTSAFDWRSIEWNNSSGWGLYGAGTANNYLAGNLSVGTTGSTARLAVTGSQPSGTTTWTAQFHNALGNSNSLMIRDDGNVGIGTNTPQSLLQIGTGSSVGSISTPALRIGTNANGFYTDTNRLFVVANGNFGGGFDSSGFIGNSVYVNTTSGVNSLNTPKLGGYRLTAQGLTSGLAGNSVGDLALTTNNIPRLTITFSGNTGIGTITPNVSSILELSSTTQGFLSPRMTTAQRDAIVSPATGLELFNTSIGSKQVYNGTEWEILNGARQAITASSSTTSIVFRNGNIADIVLSSSTTLSFSNAAVGTYIVKITQGGSGFNLVSWPANVLWSGGIIPTLTTAVGKTDIFTFVYDSTNYYGSYALNY